MIYQGRMRVMSKQKKQKTVSMGRLPTGTVTSWKKFAAMVYRLYTSVFFLKKNHTSRKLHNILLTQCIEHFLNRSDIIPCSRNQAIPLPALQTLDRLHRYGKCRRDGCDFFARGRDMI